MSRNVAAEAALGRSPSRSATPGNGASAASAPSSPARASASRRDSSATADRLDSEVVEPRIDALAEDALLLGDRDEELLVLREELVGGEEREVVHEAVDPVADHDAVHLRSIALAGPERAEHDAAPAPRILHVERDPDVVHHRHAPAVEVPVGLAAPDQAAREADRVVVRTGLDP